MNQRFRISTGDLVQVARGFMMGGADIIPGVSGGTVALVLGIYERLVTAISHFDLEFLAHVRRKEWTAAAKHIDLRFLVALGSGIALGIGGLASLMHHLLEHQREPTFAAFLGLILASSLLVARMVDRWTISPVVCLVGGTIFAYWLVGLPLLQNPPTNNGYIFVCGLIAICAMILPGISGAFILLILGKYTDITGLLRSVLQGDITVSTILTLIVFGSGCAIGLLSFSKILRWLLARHESLTMAILCGFMAGSLRKIWPFKHDLTPDVEKFKLKQFENIMPNQFDGPIVLAIVLAMVAFVFVLVLDRLTQGHAHIPPLEAEDHKSVAEATDSD